MKYSNANAPAFPIIEDGQRCDGLSKRELMAAMAMQGLLAYGDENAFWKISEVPTKAVAMADSLLRELDKTKGE